MLEILKYPDPQLRQESKPVSDFGAELQELVGKMFETMYQADGVGLAAPQVNHHFRLFIVNIDPGKSEEQKHVFINPTLRDGSGKILFDEGCLSVPGITIPVRRYSEITVDYFNLQGEPRSLRAAKLLSVAIQHEHDHLEGIMFVDRLPWWKRYWIKRKLRSNASTA